MKGILLTADSSWMNNRVFNLDLQLLVDAVILALAIFALFMALSYLLFNPAREMLRKRQEHIKGQLDAAANDKKEAAQYKLEYDEKIKAVNKESEAILSDARKKALKRETEMIGEAKQEASNIIGRANKEIELEKIKAKDEVKQEMIAIASLMAGKIAGASIDKGKQEELIEVTLKEMGDKTWQS